LKASVEAGAFILPRYVGAIVDPIVKREMLPVLSFKVFSAEDDSGVMLGQRTIDKGSGPRAKLGPLEIVGDRNQYEGGIVGLLPQVGTRQ